MKLKFSRPSVPFGLVEDAVAAANDHVVAEGTPGKAQSRPDLLHVVLRDVQRHPRLAARLNQIREQRVADVREPLHAEVDVVGLARDDDRLLAGGIEGRRLSFVAGQPRRVLVAEAQVQGQRVRDLEVVLEEAVPVGAIAAPPGRGVRPRGVRGVPEQEIGKAVAGARRRRRILRHHAGEPVGAVVIARVGEEDVPVIDPAAELEDVRPLHPGHVVGDLPLAAILPFRPAITGIARESRVA